MSVEKSGRGVLTTNAYANYSDFSWQYRCIGTQFANVDNYTVSIRFSVAPYDSDSSYAGQRFNSITFNGSTTNNLQHQELEFSVQVLDYNTENIYYETDWYPVNTLVNIASRTQYRGGERLNSYRIYIRRADGSQLNRTSMNASVATVYGQTWQNVEEQTLPSDWFQTTTQTIPTYTTQTTMVTTVDYESYLSTLTVPADVRPAIAQLDQLINDLWSLHYIPFVVCFALIMGLAIWLLH